ncbi:hypothetical protein FOA52_007107 [Chlamydomonas sp. UWO 241]|nr:hypothetical protein FOA52_007107 [Chlamydomonas sp. UWO 241]
MTGPLFPQQQPKAAILRSLAALEGDVDGMSMGRCAALCVSIHEGLDALTGSRDAGLMETAMQVLRRTAALVDAQGVFSANEEGDDIATSSLRLLLVPFVEAELLASSPAPDGPHMRYRQVVAAQEAYSHFLHRLAQYSLMGDLAGRQYAGEEDVGESAGASNPGDRRTAKIERFKEEKQLQAALADIERRRAAGTCDADADGEEASSLGGPQGGLDEEDEREAWALRLRSCALRAIESRGSVREEGKMLQAFAAHRAEERAAPADVRIARVQAAVEADAREADMRAQVLGGLRNVASSLGGSTGPSASNGRASGAPPTANALINHRDAVRAGVFRPSHTLPTMTVEEFGMQEHAEMMVREAGQAQAQAARQAQLDSRTHGQEEYDDEENEKARAWDEYKDANPAGHGNSALRPCGRALQDFGIGKTSFKEGGVGLFVLAGGAAALALVSWARGNAMRTGTPYNLTVELPLACGVTIGTPVRIRGVQVGQVLNVRPSLEKVDVLCQFEDVSSVVPRNSVVEANQSGLIAEPLLDITPQLPLPTWSAGPADAGCDAEGTIVCANGRISGNPGVALDDLVYIMTRLARQMEEDGFDKVFAAAEEATTLMREAQPLIQQSIELVGEVTPLLAELRQGGLVGNLEALTETAAAAAADIQKLQGAVLTDDNVKALRHSVMTLCRTLEHVESISSDVSLFTRDSAVQRNLRTLVQALSRMVDEGLLSQGATEEQARACAE